MIEHKDENGETVVIATETPKADIPPPQLRYVSPCIDAAFVADLCIKEGDDYVRFAVNRNQVVNMIDTLTGLLREFDKRTPEDTYNG